MREGLHLFVNNSGEVVCVYAVFAPGDANEPWRPFTYTTLVSWLGSPQNNTFTAFGRIHIHTAILNGGI